MYDEKKVEEALELCRDIDTYYLEESKKGQSKNHFHSNEDKEWAELFQLQREIPKTPKAQKESWFHRVKKEFFMVFLCLVVAYGAARFTTDYLFQPTMVDGESMEDTLHNGDILLLNRLSYRFHSPERFDMVVFPFSMDEYYVKRIIGLPGETIEISDGTIYIDGAPLLEGYGREPAKSGGIAAEPIKLGSDEYFLMGDNRNNSKDSRDASVGPVSLEQISGKVAMRIYPLPAMQVFR